MHYERKEVCSHMGLFVNPDQSAFQSALNAQIYVDGGSQSPDRWLKEPRNNQIYKQGDEYHTGIYLQQSSAQVWKIDYGGYADSLLQQRM